jgi:biopolymer transport protein ExbB
VQILELFQRGGVVMYAIALASVVALAVFVERLWALQRSRVAPRAFTAKVFALVEKGEERDALLLTSDNRSSAAMIFRAILKKKGATLPYVKEAAEEVGRQEAARLERFTGVLGTVASVSPLLGLLGTVTGMIAVFQKVAETGVGNPLDMAAGIWESLLTTAFGLGIGIPALLAHRFVLSRVDGLVLELEEESLRLVELLFAKHESSSMTEPPSPPAMASAAPLSGAPSSEPSSAAPSSTNASKT